ncbi:tryptophan 7-halogenase [Xanthobacter dioxanivorans]|uniref:Tryptophan 7-halogenase n=1 Tax=Xanthobacter dioxanivorans TaxID=2528964 RepID=A0A974SJW8_9HYPH|nr:tryptophan 7-halogenase [Xanthobacter dioxanivorans]QRG07659.1 tryptophan 7-halogenase [Xanthobacter dioxanivorans]
MSPDIRPDTPPTRVDIAIVGAGVAGCSCAIALAQRGVGGIALFDAGGQPGAIRIGETIPGAAVPLLQRLGAWDRFAAAGHLSATGGTSLWGKEQPGHNDAVFLPFGAGWHLDRAAFDRQIRERAQALGVPVLTPLKLRTIVRRAAGGYALGFDGPSGPRTVEAGFLVDASGIGAVALRGLKVARNRLDELVFHCLVLPLGRPGDVPPRTFVEAVPEGWWYASRVPGGRMVVARASDAATARETGLPQAGALRAALAETRLVGPVLAGGRPDEAATPQVRIAPTAILSAVAGADWLAVGDAAASCDPLLSQGIVRALDDGLAAGAAIADARAGVGPAPLLAYQARLFARFTANVRLRAAFYAAEGRWPDAPFWRARRPTTQEARSAPTPAGGGPSATPRPLPAPAPAPAWR